MSWDDYLSLRDYLDRPGETVLSGRVAVTHAFNRDDDRGDLMRRANEAAVLLGLHDRCSSCGGEDSVPLDEVGTGGTFVCYYCNGTGIQSAGSFTSAIDRLALCDVSCRRCNGDGWETAFVGEPVVRTCPDCHGGRLLTSPCVTCQDDVTRNDLGRIYSAPFTVNRCPDCNGMGRKPDHEWQRPRSFAQGEPCPCPRDYKRRTHKGRRQRTQHTVASPKCPWCNHGVIAHGPGVRGLRHAYRLEEIHEAGMRQPTIVRDPDNDVTDYPCGVHPDVEDDEAWNRLWIDRLKRYRSTAGRDIDKARDSIQQAVELTITLANGTTTAT